MEVIGKFILMNIAEFDLWLTRQRLTRSIRLVQQHHTWKPSYAHFDRNYFQLCNSMEEAHIDRKFSEIAQNFTIFPDGKIMACRNLNTIPAGIKGANRYGVCIENVGDFDNNRDEMTAEQRVSILEVTRSLLRKINRLPSEETVVYHHWYDLDSGVRIIKEGTGKTKSCPGENFFGGNTIDSFKRHFLPQLKTNNYAGQNRN